MAEICTGEVKEGQLPNKAEAIVKEWCISHQAELLANWQHAERFEPAAGFANDSKNERKTSALADQRKSEFAIRFTKKCRNFLQRLRQSRVWFTRGQSMGLEGRSRNRRFLQFIHHVAHKLLANASSSGNIGTKTATFKVLHNKFRAQLKGLSGPSCSSVFINPEYGGMP